MSSAHSSKLPFVQPYVGTCAGCGKRCFPSRKSARAAARRTSPGTRRNAYQCEFSGMWHFGRLPEATVRGELGRDEIWPTAPRGRAASSTRRAS